MMDDNKRLELQSMPPDLMALAKDQFGGHYIQFEIWVGKVIDQAFEVGKATERALRPEAIQRALPSGWIPVPVRATIEMHNAAAFSGVYQSPRITMDDDGYVRIAHAAPDWSRVWHEMVLVSPALPSHATSNGITK